MTYETYHEQGHTAYHSGMTPDECPYAEGTPEADAWLSGWGTAEQAEAAYLDDLHAAHIAAQDAMLIWGFDYV